MPGVAIDRHPAILNRLFEIAGARAPPIATIGIGDGGNEIGMGSFAPADVAAALGRGPGASVVSRIATDFALIAGVSNWAGYALALAVGTLRGADLSSRWFHPEGQRELIEKLVSQAGAVDGRTLKSQPTVDGLPLDVYLPPLAEMHGLLARVPPEGS
jgi:hypothetical protein